MKTSLNRQQRITLALASSESSMTWEGASLERSQTKPKVAILVRVSSLKQEKEGTIDAQLKFCHELFERHFPTTPEALVHISRNEGYNLESKDLHFDFWRLMDLIARGEVTHVIAVSMDRVFRGANKVLNAEISQLFTKHRIKLITSDGLKEYDPTNIHGQLIDSVQETLGPIAKKEMTRKLQKARRYHLTEHKQWRLAIVPFGYELKIVGTGRQKTYVYSIVEDEAEIIRDIYRLYVGQKPLQVMPMDVKHPGVKLIASHLQKWRISKSTWLARLPQGHQAKESKTWNGVFINRILRNPIYRGELMVCFNETNIDAAYVGEALVQKVQVPAIIMQDLWAGVEEMRMKKSELMQERFHESAQIANWLHRLVVCPVCSNPLGGYTSARKARYYLCRHKRGDAKHPSFSAETLEKNLGLVLIERLHKGLLWEKMGRALEVVRSDGDDFVEKPETRLAKLQGEETSLQVELNRLTEFLLKGVLSEDQYALQKKRIEANLTEIKRTIESFGKEINTKKLRFIHLEKSVKSLEGKFRNVMANAGEAMLAVLRETALSLIDRVEIVNEPHIDIAKFSIEELRQAYVQGRIVPKDLEACGWSARRITKELGLSGRRVSVNFKLVVHWKTGKREDVVVW